MADRPIPRPQEIYRHFKDKGMLYQVITIARHTETDEDMVVYQALYGDYKVYTRPLSMFMSKVDKVKYPDSDSVYRFEKYDMVRDNAADSINVKASNEYGFEDSKVNSSCEGEKADDTSDYSENNINRVSSDLLEFLDAETYEQQRNLLIHMRPRMTQRLIDDIAAAMDVTVNDGELEERYQSLLNCIKTREKYEILDRH